MSCHDADADGRDLAGERPLQARLAQRQRERDVAAGDRRAARAAVRLEHVAVDGHRALAHDRGVHHAAQRAPDEALDLVGAAAQPTLDRFALHALGGGGRQHGVLGRDPADALAAQVRRDAVLDRGRAEHVRVALPVDERRRRPLLHAQLDGHRAHLARCPPIGPVAQASADAHRPSFVRPGSRAGAPRPPRLGVLPQLVEGIEAHGPQLQPLVVREALHAGEARSELAAGRPQRRLRVDAQLAAEVDHDEQQVAELLATMCLGSVGGQQFRGLLGDLVDDPLQVRPVVAQAGGAALHLVGVGQCRQGLREPREGGGHVRVRRLRGGLGAAAGARPRRRRLRRRSPACSRPRARRP